MSEPANLSGPGSAPAEAPAGGYRVLARKYRPASFEDLIGQEAMVRTISNAFESGRIPQAWILTGVRGVGKTTTARILARALNYELPDGSIKGPTIHMPVMGVQDQAIIDSRHIDILEMDAASHNSVDDVRQINDAVRYAPVSARYKVYILDEVHMLSGAAFNALLKTLEEPPPHAKFIFATTEIRKVPVTVLSRCQRFDLRRVDAAVLVEHLQKIAAKENIKAEPAALALIARAAEGSVRDALSLFDQGIAHAAGPVRAEDVRQMLGLADRVRIVDLFEALMKGDIAGALSELRAQYDIGADPAVVLSDLAEFTHFVTRVKVVPTVADDVSLSEAERVRGRAFATQLSMRVLSRCWQMLLKGVGEVQASGRPVAAAEMVLVRIAYAADLPTPDEVIKSLGEGGGAAPSRPSTNGGSASAGPTASQSFAPRQDTQRFDAPRGAARSSAAASPRPSDEPVAQLGTAEPAAPTLSLGSFEALIALANDKRDITTKMALERDVRLVRFEDGQLEIALQPNAPKTFVHNLQRKLTAWTGKRWVVVVSREQGAPTMRDQANDRQAEVREQVMSDPLVLAVLKKFPGATVGQITQRGEDEGAVEGGDFAPPPDMDEED
ncbi:MAG: DNA polymerase III subunit gamma/tau [Pseudolabrys sp.]|nr:DNA polymerase III subunit gamma/tau [Pseudolabrys sp.]MDP2298366.1 DNA polymerase III subunit gamma/tau [Pseudolabrys sp.]